jgi:hypothetical protein
MDSVGLQVGDLVFFAINPDLPGTLLVMPEGIVEEVWAKGFDRARPRASASSVRKKVAGSRKRARS